MLNSDPSAPFVAGGGGRANAMAWYDQRLWQARQWAESDPGGHRWIEVLKTSGARHVVVPANASAGQKKALEQLGYAKADAEAGVELWTTNDHSLGNCRLLQRRDQADRIFSWSEQP